MCRTRAKGATIILRSTEWNVLNLIIIFIDFFFRLFDTVLIYMNALIIFF